MARDLFRIIEAMHRYGGNFVERLADAWQAADATNKAILEKAFAHYFDQYEKQFVMRVAAPDPR